MIEPARFGPRIVGLDVPPLIVAELSGNHNGSLQRALSIVDAAAKAGAHAVKLQTYSADTMTLDVDSPDFIIDDPQSLWHGRRLYELYTQAATPWDWHPQLFERALGHGLLCFSTPFDETAVDYLERFDPPAYKIASFELTDLALIACVAKTGRPVIMSTGMAELAEIDEAVQTVRQNGGGPVILLQCTSTYPSTPENSNIRTIPSLRETFGCLTGLSDHTAGIGAAVAAVAFGAVLIEKHFTLSRADGGVDAAFSMEPAELSSLVTESHRAWQSLGGVKYGPAEVERPSLRFRRSIYVSADVQAGECLGPHNIRIVRPGFGLPPKEYQNVVGRRARIDLKRGTALTWDAVL